ncbi:MAG TPA: YggS family pyridoxal phosphate-dependent enzyme [Armatimonadota bacterium]|nr:YggS family pyridoxal phosphate-dependent enzyme [Armatimonadota bacterium]
MTRDEIADNLRTVRERIAAAAARAGRDASEVTLVVVTKTRGLDEVRGAVAAGATDLGENYVQELVAKARELGDDGVRWHAIGHLQTNKVRQVVPVVSLIHSLDSLRLAEEIERRAGAAGRTIPALVQVNVAGEDSKFGVDEAGLMDLAPRVMELQSVRLAGLMTMPPFVEEGEDNRRYFARVRELRDDLVTRGIPADSLRELSMGMTSDYEVAVEEGATLVRVGTAIFGPRQ